MTLWAFRDAIRANGLIPPDTIISGVLHRFPGLGKSGANTAGWCLLFNDSTGGCVGDWSTGFSAPWQARHDAAYSPAESAVFTRSVQARRERTESERRACLTEATDGAGAIWRNATSPTMVAAIDAGNPRSVACALQQRSPACVERAQGYMRKTGRLPKFSEKKCNGGAGLSKPNTLAELAVHHALVKKPQETAA